MLSWPQVSWSFRTRHLRSQLPCSQGELPRGSMDGSPLLEKTPSGFVLSCHPLFSSQALSPSFPTPPHPQGPGMGQRTTAKAQAGQWGPCCVWTHTQAYTSCPGSSLVALGAMAGLGAWVWGGGGQGCWPELAWRSHSSPAKLRTDGPCVPAFLLQPHSLSSLSSPLLLLLLPLSSLSVLFLSLSASSTSPSSLRSPEGHCHPL